jgi:hypothetical protein
MAPWGSDGATIGETVFPYVYIENIFQISSEEPLWKKKKNGLIDWLFTVLRPAQEFFTYMETSP